MISDLRIFAELLLNFPLIFNKSVGITLEYSEDLHQWKKTILNGAKTHHVPDLARAAPTLCCYIGKLKNGKPTGYGTLTITPQTYSYITVYSGSWKDGRFHGKGTLKTEFSSHSRCYSGNFKDGLKYGYGRESWLGGDYKGRFENNEICGESTHW